MLCDAPARKPRTHASHTAPPLPGRDHSRSPSTRVHVCLPRAPLTVVAHDSGPDRRVTALYETMFGSTSTCSSRAFQRYHSQVRQPPPWLSTFESGVRNQVRPPFSPPPFALTAAQPTPPAPPYVCRVQPKHPCIACRFSSRSTRRRSKPLFFGRSPSLSPSPSPISFPSLSARRPSLRSTPFSSVELDARSTHRLHETPARRRLHAASMPPLRLSFFPHCLLPYPPLLPPLTPPYPPPFPCPNPSCTL